MILFVVVPQALANSATNLLVAERVPGPQRALAIGVKQSGSAWRVEMATATVLLIMVWRAVPPETPHAPLADRSSPVDTSDQHQAIHGDHHTVLDPGQ
ncbi:MAG: hypothetical protein ACRDS1_15140 [Pseudonocardiaceae bacterium]